MHSVCYWANIFARNTSIHRLTQRCSLYVTVYSNEQIQWILLDIEQIVVHHGFWWKCRFILMVAGTLFSISVFSRKLNVDDAVLGIISTTSKICGAMLMAFAKTDYEVYLCKFNYLLHTTKDLLTSLNDYFTTSVYFQFNNQLNTCKDL